MVNEDRYFLEKLAEKRQTKREELAHVAEEEAKRQSVAGVLSIDDASLAARIRALGFDGDTARVFDLLPLIHVAWADGRIQAAERTQIVELLQLRGIEPNDEAWIFVEALLEQKPSDEYIRLTLSLLRDVLKHSGRTSSSVVELCANVATAAGGFLGLRSAVSEEERLAIDSIARALQGEGTAPIQTLLG